MAVKCPICRSTKLRWSRTRIWEAPLRLLGVRPYRCRACRRRDYLLPFGLRFRVLLRWKFASAPLPASHDKPATPNYQTRYGPAPE